MAFNLKAVSTKGTFTPVADGRYNVRIEGAEERTSEAGNPVINLKLEIIDDPKNKSRIVFDSITLTDSSLWKVKTLLEKVGSKLGESDNVEAKEIATELLFKKMSVYVYAQNDASGTPRNRVKDYQPYTDPALKASETLF